MSVYLDAVLREPVELGEHLFQFGDRRGVAGIAKALHALRADVALVLEGEAFLGNKRIGPGAGYYTPPGAPYAVQAGPEGIRFLLVSGKPLREPVAWYGPIVMNTQTELRQALQELQDGTFIR